MDMMLKVLLGPMSKVGHILTNDRLVHMQYSGYIRLTKTLDDNSRTLSLRHSICCCCRVQKLLFSVLDLEGCFTFTLDILYNYIFFYKFAVISS